VKENINCLMPDKDAIRHSRQREVVKHHGTKAGKSFFFACHLPPLLRRRVSDGGYWINHYLKEGRKGNVYFLSRNIYP
jgi:hypothetical protein